MAGAGGHSHTWAALQLKRVVAASARRQLVRIGDRAWLQ